MLRKTMLAAFAVLLIAAPRGQRDQVKSPFDTPVGRFEAHDMDPLEAILKLGKDQKLAVGIMRSANDHFCSTRVDLNVSGQTPLEIADTLIRESPGFMTIASGNVLQVKPKTITASTQKLLSTRVPVFNTGQETAEGMRVDLWRFTLAVLHPRIGVAASILSNSETPTFPPVHIENATVLEIMNLVVQQGSERGAWILLPVPDDYSKVADQPFTQFINYADDITLRHLRCQDSAAPLPTRR